jgi:hypothetical protein
MRSEVQRWIAFYLIVLLATAGYVYKQIQDDPAVEAPAPVCIGGHIGPAVPK